MKNLIAWFKWIVYRIEIARELHRQLNGAWNAAECWRHSKAFEEGYKALLREGDIPIPCDDVSEEISCWSGL